MTNISFVVVGLRNHRGWGFAQVHCLRQQLEQTADLRNPTTTNGRGIAQAQSLWSGFCAGPLFAPMHCFIQIFKNKFKKSLPTLGIVPMW